MSRSRVKSQGDIPMAVTMNIHEAKTHFSKLLARVMAGEEIIIAKAGTPVARLVPIIERPVRRMAGSAAGKVAIAPDFDAPLPKDILETFER
jgi:prevent-host-death family protein